MKITDKIAMAVTGMAIGSVLAMIVFRPSPTAQQSFLTAACPEHSGFITCTTDGYSMCAENTPRYVCRDGHWQAQQ